MKNFTVISYLTLLIFLSFINCEKDKLSVKENISKGEIAKVGIIGNIAELFPYTVKGYFGQEMSNTLLNPALTGITKEGHVYPLLASAWNISTDKLNITYIINAKYKWSNGQKVSAYDVQDTYRFLKMNHEGFDNPLNYGLLRSVQVLDSLTVRVYFAAPVSDPLRRTRFPILNRKQIHDSPGFAELVENFKKNFIGCGPFLLESQNPKKIILKANPFYSGPGPFIERLHIRMFSGIDSIVAALDNNELDAALALPLRITEHKKSIKDYDVHIYLEKGFEFIGWNLRRPHLRDVGIREALTYAIDRPTIVDGVLGDYAQVEDSPVLLNHTDENFGLKRAYDLSKAEFLLKTRGWKKNKKNGLLGKKKRYFELNILANEENEIRREMAVNLAGYYKALGVKVKLEFLPWAEVLSRLKSGSFDAVIISWRENGLYDVMEMFHSANIVDGKNFLAYSNSRADQFMEWALNTDNKEIRKQTLLKLKQVLQADLPVTVLFRQKLANIISKKLHDNNGFLGHAAQWYFNGSNRGWM